MSAVPKRDFDFYRLRLFATEASFFESSNRPAILCELVDRAFEFSKQGGAKWNIGDIEELGEFQRYFRFGQRKWRSRDVYENGHFETRAHEENPYTEVFLDSQLGLLTIGRNSKLADSATLARTLVYLVGRLDRLNELGAVLGVDPIRDADGLIAELRSAYRIVAFDFTYSRPNPPDVERLVHMPLEVALDNVHAEKGHVYMTGSKLSLETIEPAARSLAASGEDVAFRFKPGEFEKAIRRKLTTGPYSLSIEATNDKASMMERLTRVYRKIRGGSDE